MKTQTMLSLGELAFRRFVRDFWWQDAPMFTHIESYDLATRPILYLAEVRNEREIEMRRERCGASSKWHVRADS